MAAAVPRGLRSALRLAPRPHGLGHRRPFGRHGQQLGDVDAEHARDPLQEPYGRVHRAPLDPGQIGHRDPAIGGERLLREAAGRAQPAKVPGDAATGLHGGRGIVLPASNHTLYNKNYPAMGARMRMRSKGERWRLAGSAAGIAAMCALAGCGSKIACGAPETKEAIEEELAQAQGLLGVYTAMWPQLQFKLELSDFVTEESSTDHAICRARLSMFKIENGETARLAANIFRYRVDKTSEGKLAVIELKGGGR